MTTLASETQARARLGDSPLHFNTALGPPLLVQPVAGGVLRHYWVNRREIAVFFDFGRAVAVYVPFGAGHEASGERFLPADFQPLSGAHERVLISDTGWIAATPSCPLQFTRAVAGVR